VRSSISSRTAHPRRVRIPTTATLLLGAAVAAVLALAGSASAAPPSNDDFAGRQVIAGLGTVTGSNVDATRDPGEPSHAGYNDGQSIWFEWTAPTGPTAVDHVQLSLRDSNFDTVLAVYTGSDLEDLSVVAFNDDYPGWNFRSRVRFDPVPGTTYDIAVDGYFNGLSTDSGDVVLDLAQVLPTGFVEGRVTDEAGNGVWNACAVAVDDAGDELGLPAYTDPNGDYTLSDVPVGTDNHVRFRNCGSADVAGEFYDDSQTLAGAADVAVTQDATTSGVDAVLATGGSITGTIHSEDDAVSDVDSVCVGATMVGGPDNGFAVQATTDADGHYTISGLDGGNYRVQFSDDATGSCGANTGFLLEYYDDASLPGDAQLVAVTEGETVTDIDAGLTGAPGAISGTVRSWLTGDGLAHMCVQAVGPSFTSPVVDTDASGGYTIPGVPAGSDHVIRFSDCHTPSGGYTTQFYDTSLNAGTATNVAVYAGHTTGLVDARMFRAATLSGQTTDDNGYTRAGVCVDLYTDTDSWVQQTTTDAAGDWSFRVVPGNYKLNFWDCGANLSFESRWWDGQVDQADADVVFADQGDVVDHLDQMLPGYGPGRIVGAVVDDTLEPLEGVCVAADDGSHYYSAETDGTGHYEITGAEPGTYRVFFSDCVPGTNNVVDQWYSDQTSSDDADEIAVVAGATTSGIDAQMHPAGSVAGTVTDAAGAPIDDICVGAFTTDTSLLLSEDYTAADGTFTVRGLPTGGYKISFYDCSLEYVDEWYDDVHDPDLATTVAVTAGETTAGIDASLDRYGTISGTMTNEAGEPVTDACAYAWTPDGTFGGYGLPDENGHYLIGGLDTGDYVVQFIDCTGTYGDEYYDNKLFEEDADQVSVVYGQDTGGIDVVLQDTAPVNVDPPTISGAAFVGQTLTAQHGTWEHEPSYYDYQWLRCDDTGADCDPINDALDPTYALTTDDAGHRIEVDATAVNSVGDTTVESAPTAVVVGKPALVDRPVVTGAPKVDAVLTTTPGTWSGDPTGYDFQWLRCDLDGLSCAAIAGADQDTYVVSAADDMHRIRARVAATNPAGTARESSAPTNVVGTPTVTVRPTITGQPRIGSVLTASTGTWTGSPTSFSFQWYRCDGSGSSCTPIGGSASSTYVLDSVDAGHRIRVYVTATNGAGSARSSSLGTNVVGLPALVTPISLSGQPSVGAALAASSGGWSGDPDEYVYQWLRCDAAGASCTPIPGATSASYVVGDDDVLHRLRARVAATNAAGSTRATSVASAVVGSPTIVTRPTITGDLDTGSVVTASTGTWNGAPETYAFQWYRCTAPVACVAILGANTSTYVIGAADADQRLRVYVTADNAAGHARSSSTITGLVG
jgi:hypothetical protein